MTTERHVKILFPLENGDDGYPTEATETLWAIDLGSGRYKIDNIPFYVKLISDGDIITASQGDDGRLYFEELEKPSDNCTFRVVMMNGSDGSLTRRELTSLGCATEGSGTEGFFSVSVNKSRFADVSAYLLASFEGGNLDFEESAIRE